MTKTDKPLLSDEAMEQHVDRLGQESTAPDKETPAWMKADIGRGFRTCREIYEKDRASQLARIKSLIDKVEKLEKGLKDASLDFGELRGLDPFISDPLMRNLFAKWFYMGMQRIEELLKRP